MKNKLIRIIWQSIIIVIIASAAGIIFNYIRKDRIPLFAEQAKLDFAIDIDKARDLFYSGNAIFIDARPYEFYKEMHIKGAINIPAGQKDKIKRVNISKNKIIIIYCSGKGCDLSKDLAMEFYALGYDNVYYIKGGLDIWISRNLPTEKSK